MFSWSVWQSHGLMAVPQLFRSSLIASFLLSSDCASLLGGYASRSKASAKVVQVIMGIS
jgi:hypothetical protein